MELEVENVTPLQAELDAAFAQHEPVHRVNIGTFTCSNPGICLVESTKLSTHEMGTPLAGCVNSLQSGISLLNSSISILDSGVNDFPRLAKVLQTTRVSILSFRERPDVFEMHM